MVLAVADAGEVGVVLIRGARHGAGLSIGQHALEPGRSVAVHRVAEQGRHQFQAVAFHHAFGVRADGHDAARLCVFLPGPGADLLMDGFFEFQRVADVAQQDFRAGRDVLVHVGIAAAVVADRVDAHVAAEVIVLQQGRARLHGHARGGFLQPGADHPARIEAEVVRTGHVARVALRAQGDHEGSGAGTDVAAAVLQVCAETLAALRGQGAGVSQRLAAVDIHHAEAGCAVGVEQGAVLVKPVPHQQVVLHQRVEGGHLQARCGAELFHAESQPVRGRQVGVGVERAASVHEEVFVVAFVAGFLCGGLCESGRTRHREGEYGRCYLPVFHCQYTFATSRPCMTLRPLCARAPISSSPG